MTQELLHRLAAELRAKKPSQTGRWPRLHTAELKGWRAAVQAVAKIAQQNNNWFEPREFLIDCNYGE